MVKYVTTDNRPPQYAQLLWSFFDSARVLGARHSIVIRIKESRGEKKNREVRLTRERAQADEKI
jgi:hypothetical protein